MSDSRRKAAAIFVLIGIIAVITVLIRILFSSGSVVSPVPQGSGIRIIILTPTPAITGQP